MDVISHEARASFLEQLVGTVDGRRHLLSVSVDAEEGDETGIFDQLADAVDDPKLRRIVERHRDDEIRHASLFRGCLARLGLEMEPVPDELKIIHQIGQATQGVRRGVQTTEDVVRTYAVLHAIEERGVEQFPLIADTFRQVDPETADVYLEVARDERGHVRYCDQIGRHYARDRDGWEQMLEIARAVETAAFTQVRLASLRYCGERGWIRPDELVGGASAG
ncbi:MAG: ferritin-like domain-containing protein, partial [Acidimicrobiia bacterium]